MVIEMANRNISILICFIIFYSWSLFIFLCSWKLGLCQPDFFQIFLGYKNFKFKIYYLWVKTHADAKLAHEKTALERQIDAIDKHIDNLVYELYGLTDEEIKIVESS